MIKWFVIGLIIFVAFIDICLIISCHKFKKEYNYYEERKSNESERIL